MVTDEEGGFAVRLARSSVARRLGTASVELPSPPALFRERRGVFVTWNTFPAGDLRGCIGFPEPVLPLAEGISEAAVAAALDDPRFPPVRADELTGLVADVSVLTPFVAVPVEERPVGVRVGRDGLSVERGRARGLLLPQVGPEQGWDAVQLLDGTCEKAGLPRGSWRSATTDVYRFQAEVFRERTPGGPVVRQVAEG